MMQDVKVILNSRFSWQNSIQQEGSFHQQIEIIFEEGTRECNITF
jgi:hypothetical protein